MDQRIGRQGGYAGMIVILIAVLIVAWLAKDALKAYLGPAESAMPTRAATPGERARQPGAVDASGATVESAAPVPTAPMDRARAVSETMKEESTKRDGGY